MWCLRVEDIIRGSFDVCLSQSREDLPEVNWMACMGRVMSIRSMS